MKGAQRTRMTSLSHHFPATTAAVLFLLFFSLVPPVQASGYLQLGFFLYEFRHEPSILSPDPTGQTDPPTPPPPPPSSSPSSLDNLTSQQHSYPDVTGDVTPWPLRTLLPGHQKKEKEDSVASRGSGGEGLKGGAPWSGPPPCDEKTSSRAQYQFMLCLDYLHHSEPSGQPCALGKVELTTLAHLGALGRDLVTFPSTLGVTSNGSVTSNPIVFGFDRWMGPVRLRVYVRCCGVSASQRAQCQESLDFDILHSPAPFAQPLSSKNVMLSGRGRLLLSLMLQCDNDSYGADCENHCRVSSPETEHAFCNVTTGEKICISGWEGADCQTDIDECRGNMCRNGAYCVNSPGSFHCQCHLGFVGSLCHIKKPVCHTMPCQHGGTCHDTHFGFLCFCPLGFVGNRCERSLHLSTNGTALDKLGVGQSTGDMDDRYFAMTWEGWYSAVVAACFFFVTLIVIICCLLRGRLYRCGVTANGSFYSMFISTKTSEDPPVPPEPGLATSMSSTSLDSSIYQNIYTITGRRPSHAVSSRTLGMDLHGPRTSGIVDDVSIRYLKNMPSYWVEPEEGCQYANALSVEEDLEDLPNLVDPSHSPLQVHRDLPELTVESESEGQEQERDQALPETHSTVRKNQKAPASSHPSDHLRAHKSEALTQKLEPPSRKPVPPSRKPKVPFRKPEPPSRKPELPKIMVTQLTRSSNDSGSSTPDSCHSPKSVRTKTSFSHSSIMWGRVYKIGESLAGEVDDEADPGSPKPAVRKALLGGLSGRKKKKASQPRLCSIRRMDSSGYEIPKKYQLATLSPACLYDTLRHSRMVNEHVYNELWREGGEQDVMSQGAGGGGSSVSLDPGPQPVPHQPITTPTSSSASDNGCYMELTAELEDVDPDTPDTTAIHDNGEEEPNESRASKISLTALVAQHPAEEKKVQAKGGKRQKQASDHSQLTETQDEPKREITTEKARTKFRKNRRPLSQRPLIQDPEPQQEMPPPRDHARAAPQKLVSVQSAHPTPDSTPRDKDEDEDSDDVFYDDFFNDFDDDDDDGMASDCGYIDVFTRRNAAV